MCPIPTKSVENELRAIDSRPTVALLPWGEVWEDFLEQLNISFEYFCQKIPFGWMVGYIHALKQIGVRTILIFSSSRFTEPARFVHALTGAIIYMMPAPKSYLVLRRQVERMGRDDASSCKEHSRSSLLFKVLQDLRPYFSTHIGWLIRELRQQNCSAILCQDYEYFRFNVCLLVGKLLRLPVFATFQSTRAANWFGRLLRPLTIQQCSGLIIGSQTEIQRASDRYKIPAANIAQIFNPIDLQSWYHLNRDKARSMFGIAQDTQVVVWHGRVEIEQKGLDVLLNAWARLCDSRHDQDLQLCLMGTGTDVEKVRQRITALPRQNIVWIDKYVTDRELVRNFLSSADVYAFPSRHEGFPVAPLEAMACGLPVVATQAPGVTEIF